jgi:hypothetical protein
VSEHSEPLLLQVPETDDDGQDILDENGNVVYKMVRWQAWL